MINRGLWWFTRLPPVKWLLLFSHLLTGDKPLVSQLMTPIVIIEDDEKIRNYLSALLAGSGEFNLRASFVSAEEAINYFECGLGDDIELVLTDIQLPGKSGIELIGWLKPYRPDIQLMVLSVYDDADRVFK